MIRHILLIELNPEASPEQVDAVRLAFEQIPGQIEGVTEVEWGVNDSPEGKNQAFTHCVLMTFEDEAARQAYLPHPKHEALKVIFRPIIKNLIVFDYSL
ncbi:Dabb family protein [Photobacterium alginatilyticum]|uniref:Dabb family protein n=1 Tax=Photobacterium alginatilyticum TaxID=1775171 RepID=A0ABW9YDC8_9GAMM|nr:Dabb family protein [Photobacterium alginatilyticum]NBI51770.1 Dabb family protein [Photobacterium alginatilyticum]